MNFNLTSTESATKMTVEIVKALLPGYWLVKDKSRRQYQVASSDLHRKGDVVVIIDNQIIGNAGRLPEPKTFNV